MRDGETVAQYQNRRNAENLRRDAEHRIAQDREQERIERENREDVRRREQ